MLVPSQNVFRRKGFALSILLMLVPLILILVGTLLATLHSGNKWSGTRYGETAAYYISEAGAAHALQELTADSAWVGGFTNLPMFNGKGSYTVNFNQTKAGFSVGDSVNNFDGDHGDSFLGSGTVPTGAALIVVEGRIGAYLDRSMFIVGTGDNTIRVEQAILTSGKIKMEGETKLTAVESMAKQGELPALVQSNVATADSGLITWDSGSGGNLLIEGEVRSAGSSSSAVDLSGYAPTDGITTNAAQVTIPPAGIVTTVYSKRSASSFGSGSNVVPSGDNYSDATSAPLIVTGDLVLQGDLYVEGDLQVTGSITGNGSVYVSGDTTLFGDSAIDADNKVALYSHGHVSLTGFDGDTYLDGIAASDSTFSSWLTDSRWALGQMQTLMLSGGWSGYDLSNVDQINSVLAPFYSPSDRNSLVSGRSGATLIRMKEKLQTLPPGPSRDFMIDKLQTSADIFSQNGNVLGQADTVALNNFNTYGDTAGIVDAANDLNNPALKLAAFNTVRQINYDKLGSSYFQGLIYTNGGFYADNQVVVLGAVVVNDDGSQSTLVTGSGDSVEPGDLVLKGGSNITYVKDFFFGPNAGSSPGPRRILLRLGDG